MMSGDARNRRSDDQRPDWSDADARRSLTVRETTAPVERRPSLPATFAPASAYGDTPEDAPIDLRKYLWIAFKHRWLILACIIGSLAVGLTYTLLQTPLYRAHTTIQINRDTDRVVNIDGVDSPQLTGAGEFFQTQYEILQSRSVAERAVKDAALYENDGLLGASAPSPWARLRQMVFGGGSSASEAGNVEAAQALAVGRVMDGLSVAPVRNSSVVAVSYVSPDPRVAATVANAVANAYIAANLDRRYEGGQYAKTFLEERIQQLRIKLEESEAALVKYAEDKQIIRVGDGLTTTESDLSDAQKELSDATTRQLRAELLWKQVEGAEGIALPQLIENEAIAALREQRSKLTTEYQNNLAFYKPGFPAMQELQSQIDEVDRQIAAEVELIKESIHAAYDAAVEEVDALTQRVEKLKTDLNDFRNRNIQYTILQREVDTNRSLYDGLLQRYKEIGVAAGVGTNNVSVIDRATVPAIPFSPSMPRALMASLAMGLLLGGLGAFAREHFDDRFKSPEDIEEGLGLPLLGIIPVADFGQEQNPLDDTRSPVSEAYRSLRTAIQFSTSDGVPRSLLVTSSRPGEGKTTTAVALARNFAHLGLRVLLIDADLRRPSLHKQLNLKNEAGLTDCLARNVSPPQVFQDGGTEGLTVLTSGTLPPNPAELIAGPTMMSLLTIAIEKFDLVIVDGPPVAGLADAPLLSSLAAGTLLVVDSSATRKGFAKAALKRLFAARAQVIGAVINKVDQKSQGYGYGYGGEYGYAYAYGDAGYYSDSAPEQLNDDHEERRDA